MTQFSPDRPYHNLPKLPPSVEIETASTLKAAVGARVAVESLRQTGRLVPSQEVLLRSLVLQEAKMSSELENIVTTNDELYREASRSTTLTPSAREVQRYAEAIWLGTEQMQRGATIGCELAVSIASKILQRPVTVREGTGTRIGNPATGKVVYTPPQGAALLTSLLDNLARYHYAADELDPLVKLAIEHYQFEAIHPFSDGNGRTGRILAVLGLVERDLLDQPVLYLSRPLLENRKDYYAGLRRVTEHGDWERWVRFMLESIEFTAVETRRRLEAIHAAVLEAKLLVTQRLPRVPAGALVDLVFSRPYTKIAFLEDAGIAKRQTASVYLQDLSKIGLLRPERRWREVYHVNDALLAILSA